MGGATIFASNKCSSEQISIHAPRGGSDHQPAADTDQPIHFNPRSPWGERLRRCTICARSTCADYTKRENQSTQHIVPIKKSHPKFYKTPENPPQNYIFLLSRCAEAQCAPEVWARTCRVFDVRWRFARRTSRGGRTRARRFTCCQHPIFFACIHSIHIHARTSPHRITAYPAATPSAHLRGDNSA